MEKAILPIIIVCALFLIHYIIFNFETGIIKALFSKSTSNFWLVVTSRITGFILFFLVPYILSDNIRTSIMASPQYNFLYLFLFILLSIVPFVINYFEARTTENLSKYPQIRILEWDKKAIVTSSITWILYLIGYEYMLRYYLFYSSLQYYSLFIAILLNVTIYAIIHIHKGLKEVVGSLIMGFFLCYVVYLTGSFWTAVWFHVLLALSNEWFSIYYTIKQKVE